jgi:hypothetical protein
MTDLEYYTSLITYGCEGCFAYEEIGCCGTWENTCSILKFHNFLQEMNWDEEYFLDLIFFEDNLLPEFWQEEDEYFKELSMDLDYQIQLMQDLEYAPDEPQ